jgi:hypothetical protein
LLGARAIVPYRVLWCIAAFVGAVTQLDFAWQLADTLNALMAVPNLIALLASDIIESFAGYATQSANGSPVPTDAHASYRRSPRTYWSERFSCEEADVNSLVQPCSIRAAGVFGSLIPAFGGRSAVEVDATSSRGARRSLLPERAALRDRV